MPVCSILSHEKKSYEKLHKEKFVACSKLVNILPNFGKIFLAEPIRNRELCVIKSDGVHAIFLWRQFKILRKISWCIAFVLSKEWKLHEKSHENLVKPKISHEKSYQKYYKKLYENLFVYNEH